MTSVSPLASSRADPTFGGRHAPWDNDAEQAVLGACILDQTAALKAAEVLRDDMFYREAHRLLFRSMLAVVERRDVLDPITLKEEVLRRGDLDRVGGMEYIATLLDVVPTAANIEFHSKIVRDKALLRHLIEASTQIIQDAYTSTETAEEVLDGAEHKIFTVAQIRRAEDFVRLKTLVWPTVERIEQMHLSPEGVLGVASGFKELDEITAGFQRSDLIIVAARPSMGKTAFVLNIAQHAAIENQVPVAIFSLEMSKDALVQRMLCAEGLVDSQRLRRGKLYDSDYPLLARAAGRLSGAPIWVDDTAALSPLEMRSKARRLKLDADIGLVIVDYLQLMRSPARSESRQQEISFISSALKGLAKELQVPVIALSQLSRAPETRGGDRRPQLSDLRESGAIEQDADVVLFIYRPEMYGIDEDDDKNPTSGVAEVIVGKQRNGPTGTIKLRFRREFTRFSDEHEKHSLPPPPPSVYPLPPQVGGGVE